MSSPTFTPDRPSPTVSAREAKRLETRARLFDAAVVEIGKSGLAHADVSTIAAEVEIVARLATKQPELTDLDSVLSSLVREVLAAEQRLGPVFFRDMLGL